MAPQACPEMGGPFFCAEARQPPHDRSQGIGYSLSNKCLARSREPAKKDGLLEPIPVCQP